MSTIHDAAEDGQLEYLAALVENDRGCVHARDKDGCTPLHLAAQEGRLEVIEILLAHGAEIDARDSEGDTPLDLARRHGGQAALDLLLQAQKERQDAKAQGMDEQAGREETREVLEERAESDTFSAERLSETYDWSIVLNRWASVWLDYLLIFVVPALLVSETEPGPIWGLWLILLVAYFPLLEGLAGYTIGKCVFGIRVVDVLGRRPGLMRGIVRTLFRILEVNPYCAGGVPAGIIVLCSKKKQRLGDMAAGTYVVKAKDLPAA